MWRSDLGVQVGFISTNSTRLFAFSLCSGMFKLALINVYMSYDDRNTRSDELFEQLAVIGYLIEQNSDCHVVLGREFNVDLSREWLHTEL